MLEIIGICMAAYLVGSIPCGYLIARFQGVDDIRDHGSGSIGATNVARMLGLKYFFVVLFCDLIKAYMAIVVVQLHALELIYQVLAASFLLIGNAYPLFLQRRGGKGIATMVGILCALNLPLLLYACMVWLWIVSLTRTVGKASIGALLMCPLISAYVLIDSAEMVVFISMIVGWGLFRHRHNIMQYATGSMQQEVE